MLFWKKKEVEMKNEFKVGDIVYLKDDIRCEPYKVVEEFRGGIYTVIRIKNFSRGTSKWVSEDCICKCVIVSYNRNPYDDTSITDKPKLKIKLYNKGSDVIFQVLEQSEDLRCNEIVKRSFTASNGFGVMSDSIPQLGSGYISIRGYIRRYDDFCLSRRFNSEKEAEEYVRKALEALQEFSDINYFQGDKENIYEF